MVEEMEKHRKCKNEIHQCVHHQRIVRIVLRALFSSPLHFLAMQLCKCTYVLVQQQQQQRRKVENHHHHWSAMHHAVVPRLLYSLH